MRQGLRRIGVPIVALGLLLGAVRPAQAAIILTMKEQGGNVVVEGGGTADVSGLSVVSSDVAGGPIVAPFIAFAIIGPAAQVDVYSGLSGPGSFGTGTGAIPSSSTDDIFGVFGNVGRLVLPSGYASTQLEGSSVYEGTTFATLGVTPGTYVWTWPVGVVPANGVRQDSLTLNIVPEPVSLSLLAVGAAGLGVRRWRRRTV